MRVCYNKGELKNERMIFVSTRQQILEVKTHGAKAYYWIDERPGKFVAKVRGKVFSSGDRKTWNNQDGEQPGKALAKLDELYQKGEGRKMSYLEWDYEYAKTFR